jgi:two-component sensor histidine kinase/HAMP domain-containing protein
MADIMASAVAPALACRDSAGCRQALVPFTHDEDLLFAVVLDNNGYPLYSYVRERGSDRRTSHPAEVQATRPGPALTAESAVFHSSKYEGSVLVGYSPEPVNSAMGFLASRTVKFTAVFLLAGTVLALFAGLWVSGPLRRLTGLVRNGSNEPADPGASDEIGFLGKKIHDLSAALAIANAEVQRMRDSVEQRIAERTRELEREIHTRRNFGEQLRATLLEREILLKEIHHRVKNNLQVIWSMLNLQSHALTDPGVQEILRVSQGRIRSMATIHEMLYRSDDLAHIDFSGYVRTLSAQLFRSYSINPSLVQLELDIHPVALTIESAIPCGLIINELISNALKYAFPGGRSGRIQVVLEQCEEVGSHHGNPALCSATGDGGPQICLTVSDNGIGLPETVDPSSSSSLGLMLVSTLTDQLDGVMTVQKEGGTTFRIVFRASTERPSTFGGGKRTLHNNTQPPPPASSTRKVAASRPPASRAYRP